MRPHTCSRGAHQQNIPLESEYINGVAQPPPKGQGRVGTSCRAKEARTSVSPIARTTMCLRPQRTSSLTSLSNGALCEPATKPPASCAMIAPAQMSQGLWDERRDCQLAVYHDLRESADAPASDLPILSARRMSEPSHNYALTNTSTHQYMSSPPCATIA